jgi:glycosyltransferase involved in cell wall biosynthesis
MATVLGRNTSPVTQTIEGVCFVAPELDRIGGYELATLALARCVRQRGIPVTIVTTTKESVTRRQDDGLIRIDLRGRLGGILVFPRLLKVLVRQRVNYSILHCSTFGYLSGLTVLAARVLRRPTLLRVATENDVREFADGRHWKPRLFFYLLRSATGVIAPSDAIRKELLGAGFPDKKIFVVPNAVDVERFRPAAPGEQAEAKRVLNLPADRLVIGTVARLVQRKGIDVLLRAFARVLPNHCAQLIIIGDGPLSDGLHALAKDLRIDRSVTWLGLQADPEKWLRAMDVFAFPSRLEGSPNAILEAMATGLPIVATAIGGVVDLIQEGVTGVLVPPDDPDMLAAALARLARDADRRTNMGSHAHLRAVEVFSLDKTISRVIDLYTNVTKQR